MTGKHSERTVFAEVTLTKNGVAKYLSDGTVMADSKAIYVGSTGNWKFSWKHVEEVTFEENRSLSIKNIKDETFECYDADPLTFQPFFELVQKQWSKRQGKLEPHVEPVTSTRHPTKVRRTYGRSGKSSLPRPRVDITYFSYEDEKETTRESWGEPEEQTDISPAHEEDDASIHDENTAGDEKRRDKHRRTKRRLQRKGLAHDEDSDDDVFDGSALTTPVAQRVVSPANATPQGCEAPADPVPSTKGNSTITSFFGPANGAKTTVKTKTQRAASPTKTGPTLSLSVTPTRRPLKRDTEWLTSPRSTPRSKQARSSFFNDDDNSDIDSVSATPPPKNIRSGLFSNKKCTTDDRDNIESTPPPRGLKQFYDKLPPKQPRRGFQPQATPLRASPKRSLADSALAFSSRSPKRPIINPYKAKPREVVVPRCPFSGLRNLGNTCYLNSSLQMLYSLPTFVASLAGRGGDLAKSIVSVWDDLKDTSSLRATNPTAVKKAMDAVTDKFVGYEQRDAHEFLSDLVDRVHDELEEETKESGVTEDASPLPTDEFFRMNVQVCLTCDSCGYARAKEEMYRHLSLDIEDHVAINDSDDSTPTPWSIQRAIERFFEPEKRELKCEKCEQGASATQTLRILSCPQALLLHLKRFAFEEKPKIQTSLLVEKEGDSTETAEATKRPPAVEMTLRKNKAPVAIDANLSLRPFIATDDEKENIPEETYDLKSVVCHIGSTAFSGHYTADAIRVSESKKNGHQTDKWISFDDGVTSVISIDEITKDEKNQRTAYMLLYTLQT